MTALHLMATWRAPTAAGAVVDATGDVVEAAGRTDAVLRLASISKLLVTYAVLVAVEEGTVALDDEVGPPRSSLRHLLAHASGLSPDDHGRVLAGPGRRRIYSNVGIEVVADHVERRAEMPFVDYLTAAVLDPLAMKATTLRGSPAAFVHGTVDDLARFVAELLHPTLVSPATLAAATTVAFPGLKGVVPGLGSFDPCDWGLGFELRDHKSPHWTGTKNSAQTYGHFGGSGTFLWVDPLASLGCVVLTDREFGPWALEAWPPLSDAVLAAHGRGRA
jgi:CubicO group peptidase (beta-lactamase class C family)